MALCQMLRTHFTKAHGSPFLQNPLAQQVGYFGEGPAAQTILEGTFVRPQDMDEYTKLFIQALQFADPHNRYIQILQLLKLEGFIAHWKKA